MTGAVQWTKTVQIVIDEAGATDALEIGPSSDCWSCEEAEP